MSIIKPNREDRIKYTFTKAQRVDFLDIIKGLGIPTIVWDEMGLIIEEYSKEHLMEFLVKTVINLQEKIKNLEKNDKN